MATPTPTSAPLPYNCGITASLPLGGTEILLISAFFLFIIATLCVTFLAVAAKQMWPSKYLDPAVATRVAKIQSDFPGLGGVGVKPGDEEAALKLKTTPTYDRVVATEPYIAGGSVDDDLVYVLANRDAYRTVSKYCSSTVRGYTMLSTSLMVAGISLCFMWIHNVMLDPSRGTTVALVALVGYAMILLTSIVMCPPASNSVHRNTNICLFSCIKLTNGGAKTDLAIHLLGVTSFCLLPFLSHGYSIVTQGHALPNYATAVAGVTWQLIGLAMYAVPNLLKSTIGVVTAAKLSIIGEVVLVFASLLAFVSYEFYPTAACVGKTTEFHSLIATAAFTPLAYLVKHYNQAPSTFVTEPSVMLMNGDTPVATSGPVSALQFDEDRVTLPVVLPS